MKIKNKLSMRCLLPFLFIGMGILSSISCQSKSDRHTAEEVNRDGVKKMNEKERLEAQKMVSFYNTIISESNAMVSAYDEYYKYLRYFIGEREAFAAGNRKELIYKGITVDYDPAANLPDILKSFDSADFIDEDFRHQLAIKLGVLGNAITQTNLLAGQYKGYIDAKAYEKDGLSGAKNLEGKMRNYAVSFYNNQINLNDTISELAYPYEKKIILEQQDGSTKINMRSDLRNFKKVIADLSRKRTDSSLDTLMNLYKGSTLIMSKHIKTDSLSFSAGEKRETYQMFYEEMKANMLPRMNILINNLQEKDSTYLEKRYNDDLQSVKEIFNVVTQLYNNY